MEADTVNLHEHGPKNFLQQRQSAVPYPMLITDDRGSYLSPFQVTDTLFNLDAYVDFFSF